MTTQAHCAILRAVREGTTPTHTLHHTAQSLSRGNTQKVLPRLRADLYIVHFYFWVSLDKLILLCHDVDRDCEQKRGQAGQEAPASQQQEIETQQENNINTTHNKDTHT